MSKPGGHAGGVVAASARGWQRGQMLVLPSPQYIDRKYFGRCPAGVPNRRTRRRCRDSSVDHAAGCVVSGVDSQCGRRRDISVKLHCLAYLTVALAMVLLPGCARSVNGTPVAAHGSSSGAKSSSGHPVKDYDISRLSKLQTEFPPGFARVEAMPLTTLGPVADKFSSVGIGEVVSVDPPRCRSLIQPVTPPSDAQFTMVAGVGTGAIMVAAVKSRGPLPVTTAPADCDHAAVVRKMGRRHYDSMVKHLPGPSIDGVTTTGTMDVAALGNTKSYVFVGFLSDTVAVAVQGLLPGDPQAEDTLQDLLVRAVDAIRAG